MPELLLELFSEEIPARMQAQAARDLGRLFGERLSAAGLTADGLRTFAGPRRLTLVCELPLATADQSEEIKGPKTSAPAQALEGFLKKTRLSREQLTERGGVLFARMERPGRATPEIVAEAVEAVVRGFPWPKSMRWGTGTLRWVRPLKRIVCLFDRAVVPLQIDGIAAGDLTEGHRFMGEPGPFSVGGFEDYRRKLSDRFVVLEAEERKARILEGARAACAEAGLALVEDEGLLEEVAGLAEWPVPILGSMDPAFLDLPPEVIRTSMRTHQKYFAVRPAPPQSSASRLTAPPQAGEQDEAPISSPAPESAGEGDRSAQPRGGGGVGHTLAPNFVAVANIEPTDGGAAVAAGNARVLSARLNDARFFWDEDCRAEAVQGWLDRLAGVTFHAKLGTMADRVERIAALARAIAPTVRADFDLAEAAARLCKADLLSSMVAEFPELQGTMAGYYVRRMAEPPLALGQLRDRWSVAREPIADAVRDHYRPQGPGDAVSTAPLTVSVALADKLDTLVGFFAVNEKPTGSKDPYALRRAALGVIRLILESGARIELRHAVMQKLLSDLTSLVPGGISRIQGSYQDQEANADLIALLAAVQRLPLASNFLLPDAQRIREIIDLEPAGYDRDTIDDGWLERVDRFTLWHNKVEEFRQGETTLLPDIDELGREAAGWAAATVSDLLAFFADRLKVLLREQGQRHDLVDAVFALGDDDLVRIVARVRALEAFLATEDGANLLSGYRRAANILKAEAKKHPGEAYDGDLELTLMSAPEEAELSAALTAASLEVGPRLEAEDFAGAMSALARLRGPVDAFFERVLVNDPDAAVRLNRLRLLGRVQAEMGRVADFSQIVG